MVDLADVFCGPNFVEVKSATDHSRSAASNGSADALVFVWR
jgi:hypothetical protein